MIEGYRSELGKNNIRFSKRLVRHCDNYKESEAYEAMQGLLDLASPPTAVIAFDDILAMGAVRAIQQRGCQIPDDVAVMGAGDIFDSKFLSTVDRNIPIAVEEALQMLMRLVHQQPLDNNVHIISSNLIIHESSG